MADQKTIAVLTSGGDAQGMNAAVVQTVKTATALGYKVIGFIGGYRGVYNGDYEELTVAKVNDWIRYGGTKLYSARFPEMKEPAMQKECAQKLKDMGIYGLVVIGGDGSFQGAARLCENGVPAVAVPGSIDNDISATDFTIGFDTAVNIAVNNISMLRDTMESHDRCNIVEVLGRYCGDIAVYASVAGGADAVIVPETFNTEEYEGKPTALKNAVKKLIVKALDEGKAAGKHSQIIVVAEGVFMDKAGKTVVDCLDLAAEIRKENGYDIRGTVLGHIQRGGTPSASDRVLACKLADRAVKLLDANKKKRVVSCRGNKVVDDTIATALAKPREIDRSVYDIAPLLFHGKDLKYTR